MSAETWKSVVGFEGIYEVSDHGRVRSIDRIEVYDRVDQYSGRTISVRRRHIGRILRAAAIKSGHLYVMLGRGEHRLIHTLVLEAFVGRCPPRHECCHRDDVPHNNRLSNLRWGTRSDNLRDAVRNGRKATGSEHRSAKLTDSDIPYIRSRSRAGRGSVAALAREFGVNETTIRQVRDGKTWKQVGGLACS